MKFVYATDLHGDIPKYEAVLHFAVEQGIGLIHLGADLLPKGSHIQKEQKAFVNGYLKTFYSNCSKLGIKVLAFFGNDDLYSRKKYFRSYGELLDENPFIYDNLLFTAYPFVPDYPFGLKSACKLDYSGWKRPEQYSDPVDVDENGFYKIEDIRGYFADKGTIEDDLKKLTGDVVAIHCPPCGVELDVIQTGQRVGSKAVLDWVKKKQPRLLLCGHIHESFCKTGIWKADIGNTVVIQPGQMSNSTNLVLIEIEDKTKANLVQI